MLNMEHIAIVWIYILDQQQYLLDIYCSHFILGLCNVIYCLPCTLTNCIPENALFYWTECTCRWAFLFNEQLIVENAFVEPTQHILHSICDVKMTLSYHHKSLQKCTFQMHKHSSKAIALLSSSLPVHLVSVVPRSCPSSRTNHNVFSKPTIVPAIDCDKGNSEIAM